MDFYFIFKLWNIMAINSQNKKKINEKFEIKCAEDDTECQIEKAEKFDLRDSLRS